VPGACRRQGWASRSRPATTRTASTRRSRTALGFRLCESTRSTSSRLPSSPSRHPGPPAVQNGARRPLLDRGLAPPPTSCHGPPRLNARSRDRTESTLGRVLTPQRRRCSTNRPLLVAKLQECRTSTNAHPAIGPPRWTSVLLTATTERSRPRIRRSPVAQRAACAAAVTLTVGPPCGLHPSRRGPCNSWLLRKPAGRTASHPRCRASILGTRRASSASWRSLRALQQVLVW
jgi:hypothetical protein